MKNHSKCTNPAMTQKACSGIRAFLATNSNTGIPITQFNPVRNDMLCKSHMTCNAGTYVSNNGTFNTDRSCTACASGTFSGTTNAASCKAHTVCKQSASQYMISAPTSAQDRQCGNCIAGHMTDKDNGQQCHSNNGDGDGGNNENEDEDDEGNGEGEEGHDDQGGD